MNARLKNTLVLLIIIAAIVGFFWLANFLGSGEKAQSEKKVTPTYKVLDEQGPDHDKVFRVGVFFGAKQIAEGSGPAKQDAEVEAAKKALELL